jgi:hypothetical protein
VALARDDDSDAVVINGKLADCCAARRADEGKSMREALKGLEESMQIFKLVLTLKNQPGN